MPRRPPPCRRLWGGGTGARGWRGSRGGFLGWGEGGEGLAEIGHDGQGFAFDNEGPRHWVWLHPHQLADRPVTNAEWQAFMAAGGYSNPLLRLAHPWVLA